MPKPDRNQRTTRVRGIDKDHYKRTDRYARQVKDLYDEAAREYASLASTIFEPDPSRPFSFADYPRTQKKAAAIASELTANVERVIEAGARSEWLAATYRADEYLGTIIDRSKLTPDEIKQYEDRNLEGLAAFQGRKVQGLSLSDRVWNVTNQFTGQMELAIDVSLGEGKSAAELSRDVRGLLGQPNKLFRRVRDKYGNLRLSKAAAAYHPGRGVYRSSYQNAMRLARTEINMAYKTADWERWQREEFVVGIRIGLSNNHTIKDSKGEDQPLKDICDELAGDYPKTFKFVGWHPNCRCVVTPILKDPKEMQRDRRERLEAIMKDEEYKAQPSANEVNDVPQGFKLHIKAIAERSKGWKSQPFYIRDNFKGGKISGGLSPAIPHKTSIGGTDTKPNQPPTPCTEFDGYINDLKERAYCMGLDVSQLDPLRASGDRDALKAEVDRLLAIEDERAVKWYAAGHALSNFIKGCKRAPSDFVTKYNKIWRANTYDLKRYYKTSTEALEAALRDAQAEWAKIEAEVRRKEAEKAKEAAKKAKDCPDTQPDEVRPGGKWLGQHGDDYEFNKDFFRLLKHRPTVEIERGGGSYCTNFGRKIVLGDFNRNARSAWERRKVVYHEFGHAIGDQRGLIGSKELGGVMDTMRDRWRKREKDFIWVKQGENIYDPATGRYSYEVKKVRKEVNQMRIKTLSAKIDNIYNKLCAKKPDDPIFTRFGISYYDAREQICSLMDTLRALVNRSDVGWGHSVSYFKSSRMQEHEFLAHAFENAFIGNRIFQLIMPVEYQEMINYINTLSAP